MRYAILSDIHANWQAWQVVRNDISRQRVDRMICLGDVIGYGSRPREVLEDVQHHCDDFVLGNHDAVVCGRLDRGIFDDTARELIEWTEKQVDGDGQFFADIPLTMELEHGRIYCVHADAAMPEEFDYIDTPEDAIVSLECVDADIVFVGHTHVAGAFEMSQDMSVRQETRSSFLCMPGRRYVVNVGSVGDPRDLTREASYALYDTETERITIRRLPFDCDAYVRDLRVTGSGYIPWFLSH